MGSERWASLVFRWGAVSTFFLFFFSTSSSLFLGVGAGERLFDGFFLLLLLLLLFLLLHVQMGF